MELDLLNWTNTTPSAGISSSVIFANTYTTRSENTDTVFRGNPPAGTGARVEYVRYDYANSHLVYSCVIYNTGRNVIGNIVDTTVSDERLKTDIEDYAEECSECIKNVKVHKFKYKDEKYKDADKYGFIAQELLENLPIQMKGKVREVKERDSDDNILTINYMKLSVILWKCLQEEVRKREHIEARLFELEDAVKDLKTPKAKTRSKRASGDTSKTKSKSKDN